MSTHHHLIGLLGFALLGCDPGIRMEGKITDEGGRPLSGALVRMSCGVGGPAAIEVRSDAAGQVRGHSLGCLTADCTVEASAAGRTRVVRRASELCVADGRCGCKTLHADLALQPAGAPATR
jgi:hypothetical protein